MNSFENTLKSDILEGNDFEEKLLEVKEDLKKVKKFEAGQVTRIKPALRLRSACNPLK